VTAATAAGRAQTGDSTHLPALDGVRGIAILLVMQFHFWAMPFRIFRRPPTLALDTHINQAFEFGWTGVDLFFVLSGFLITGILLRAKGGGSYFRAFYGRRVLRIFPLYWGYLAFVILITPLLGGALEEQAHAGNVRDHWYWYFGYAVNIWSSVKQAHPDLAAVNLHFWSLAFEEQFYLVWPVIVFLLSRQRLARVCLGLLITTALFRVYLVSPLAEGWAKPNASQVLLPGHLDPIVLGALLAVAAADGRAAIARLASWAPAAAVAAAGVLLVLVVVRGGLSPVDRAVAVFGFTPIAVLGAALVLMAIAAPPGSATERLLTTAPLRFFGRYSYAMYVFHPLVAFTLVATHGGDFLRTTGGSQAFGSVLFATAATAITVAAAWLSWYLWERHFLLLKRFFPYRPETSRGRDPLAVAHAGFAPAGTNSHGSRT
jgi:peptidoglycan/LPS O-acetylase OafA/YrhL